MAFANIYIFGIFFQKYLSSLLRITGGLDFCIVRGFMNFTAQKIFLFGWTNQKENVMDGACGIQGRGRTA